MHHFEIEILLIIQWVYVNKDSDEWSIQEKIMNIAKWLGYYLVSTVSIQKSQ